jgi:hypothetical protein
MGVLLLCDTTNDKVLARLTPKLYSGILPSFAHLYKYKMGPSQPIELFISRNPKTINNAKYLSPGCGICGSLPA